MRWHSAKRGNQGLMWSLTHPPPSLWAWSHSKPAALPLSQCCNPTLKETQHKHTHTNQSARQDGGIPTRPHLFPRHGNPIPQGTPSVFSAIEWAKWGLTFGIWTLPQFSLPLKGWELFPLFDMCVSLRTTWKDQSRAPGQTLAPDTADMSGMSLRTQCTDKKMIHRVYGKQWQRLHFWGECSETCL